MDDKNDDNKSSKETVKLKHPFQLNGQKINELTLDFEALSADEQFHAEWVYSLIYKDRQPPPAAYPRSDSRFHLVLALTAAGLNPEEAIPHVRGKDNQRLLGKSVAFCMAEEEETGPASAS